jgi:hypothetical protein
MLTVIFLKNLIDKSVIFTRFYNLNTERAGASGCLPGGTPRAETGAGRWRAVIMIYKILLIRLKGYV